MSGLYKGVSGLSLFISIPLMIGFFGDTDYGLWVLVFALFQWVFSMDFGLASVLKSKVPILVHENKFELLKSYIKSTYKITAFIALILFSIFIILCEIIDIKSLLKVPTHSSEFIKHLFILNMFLFCINFILNVQKSLFVAFLKGKYAEQSIALNQFIFFLTLLICVFCFHDLSNNSKLILVTILNGTISLLVNLFYTFYFFHLEKLNLKTKTKTSKEFIKEIIFLGAKYMFIQVGLLIVFSSDNYILSNAFGPKEVVPYEIVNKLFQFPIMILFAALSPLWSMFAKHYVEGKRELLLSTFRKFNLFFIVILFFIIVSAIISPFIISIWIKESIIIPRNLILFTAIVTILRVFVSFYSFFLYGIGKVNNYLLILLLSILLKIPLSYYLIELNFGINSVILSTLLLMLFWIVFIPYESYKIVYKLKVNE
jgi:O-antigen/teichoic acid export membrane protein